MRKENLKEEEILSKMSNDEFSELITGFIHNGPDFSDVFDDKPYRIFETVIKVLLISLLIGFIGFVLFNKPSAYRETRRVKNRIEIIEKLKQGNFNQEELDYILSGDKKLKK
jgi:hypothetical protein